MKTLKSLEIIILKRICGVIPISYDELAEIFLRIKIANKATEADLSQLQALNIPIFQAIFSMGKSRNTQQAPMSAQLTFEDVKTIFGALIERNGLLYTANKTTPKYEFSPIESAAIRRLLRQAKGLARKERQDILAHLRIQYNFFPSAVTASRSRFDDEAFDDCVRAGKIKII